MGYISTTRYKTKSSGLLLGWLLENYCWKEARKKMLQDWAKTVSRNRNLSSDSFPLLFCTQAEEYRSKLSDQKCLQKKFYRKMHTEIIGAKKSIQDRSKLSDCKKISTEKCIFNFNFNFKRFI